MYVHSIREFLDELFKIFKERRFLYSVQYCFWVVLERIWGTDYIKNEGYEKSGTTAEHSSVYQATRDIFYLKKVLKKLSVKKADAILDLGCGKGYMLKFFSRYGFYKVGGVEISKRLSAIAKHNIRKDHLYKCIVYHADAGEFKAYDEYTYIYMFNPFPAVVMEKVM